MLEVQIGDEWKALGARDVARAVLDGGLERSSPARNRLQHRGEGPLDQLLDPLHRDAISQELLSRLHLLYLRGPSAFESAPLRERLKALGDFGWDDPVLSGRVLWLSAWIEELRGSWQKAIHLYSTFLDQAEPEPVLRLLAYNNRGVLRCRFGRPGGVLDLGRAAFSMDLHSETSRLPAACFNLLNLVNVAFRSESLRVQVDRALVEVFVRLPPPIRRRWIGPDPVPEGAEAGALPRRAEGDGARAADRESSNFAAGRLREKLTILSVSSLERLNFFTSQLARAARDMAPLPRPDRRDIRAYREAIVRQLLLWRARPQADVAGEGSSEPDAPSYTAHLHEVAEAASLLYARQVPSSLRPEEGSVNWLERKLREVLRRVSRHLDKREYDLAERFLRSVIAEAPEDAPDPRVRSLRYRAIEELETVKAHEQNQREQEIHMRWERLSRTVDEIRAEKNLYRARQRWNDLASEYEWLREALESRSGDRRDRFLRDLVGTVEEHLEELERRELEKRLLGARARFFDLRPSSWNTPVSAECWRALAECRLQDPNGIIQDWAILESELRAHDARHLFERAIAILCGSADPEDTRPVEDVLAAALASDRSLASACAPVLGLLHLPGLRDEPERAKEIRDALVGAARTLVETVPLAGDEGEPVLRSVRVQRAAGTLRRLLEGILCFETRERVASISKALADGFEKALAEAEPERIDEIEVMITACLDVSPDVRGGTAARSDPRNPLAILLEDCSRLRALGLAERALNAREPRIDEAAALFHRALDARLRSASQLRRAVVGCYLSDCGRDDSSEEKRRVLDHLEEWVDEIDDELIAGIDLEKIEAKVRSLRVPEAWELIEVPDPTGDESQESESQGFEILGELESLSGFYGDLDKEGPEEPEPRAREGTPGAQDEDVRE